MLQERNCRVFKVKKTIIGFIQGFNCYNRN